MGKLYEYLQFDFVRNALIVGVLIALAAALLGIVLVLKRFSFIGESLSRVAFCTVMVAGAAGLSNNIFITLVITVSFSVLLMRNNNKAKISGDSLTAMTAVGSLAIGYLFINLFPQSSNVSSDVCSVLFGSTSILTLSSAQVIISIVLAAAVLIAFVLFYNKLFSVTFDSDFAQVSSGGVKIYNVAISVFIAVIVTLATNLVGSLLMTALLIFPTLSAMRVFISFKGVSVCASITSVGCALSGMLIAILLGTPVGATIVACNIVVFVAFTAIGAIVRRK